MTISQIKYFLEAVDCGSFQKASEKLYISRQALSKQIRAVETELGFDLLERKTGGSLKLSKAGEILYDTWKELLRRHENAIFLAEGLAREQKKVLHVGLQNTTQILRNSISVFTNGATPKQQLAFEYRIGSPEELCRMLDTKEIDLAILLYLTVEHVDRYLFSIIDPHPENPVIAVSMENPLSQADRLELQDLGEETFIMIDASYSQKVVSRQKRDFEANHFYPKKIKYVPDPRELELALVTNQGVALIHQMLLEDVKDKVKMFPFQAAEENHSMGTVILWTDHKYDAIAQEIRNSFGITAETGDD